MSKKIPVGILGATGMVGQKYIQLLENHPFFEVVILAASSRSSNQIYSESVFGRWQMSTDIPNSIASLQVVEVDKLAENLDNPSFLKNYLPKNFDIQENPIKLFFSCFEIPDKERIRKYENEFAKFGFVVVSNASANRWAEDIPMLLPEINTQHLEIISMQKKNRNFQSGCIVVKPNCSLQSYLTPLYALEKAGFELQEIIITTMQAVSGAGYPGISSLDMIDNLVPFIDGEEKKSEQEPLKILGKIKDGKFVIRDNLKISATCIRVPVTDGHTASVSVKFKDKKPNLEQVLEIWQNFKSVPQELDLPFAPKQPIRYIDEPNRPQPKKDKDKDKGMAVTVGRLRECSVFDIKFVALSHNTVRGAAGGGILNAEVLYKKGYLD
jgi:aspartate-semialdehyde dehydrogenase